MEQFLTDKKLLSQVNELLKNGEASFAMKDGSLMIPYIMNDAVESVIVLHECALTGDLERTAPAGTTAETANDGQRRGLILHYPDGHVCSAWFSIAARATEAYDYSRIGHVWRGGLEHWRRVTNALGVMADKGYYLGGLMCSQKEADLMGLVTFGPLMDISPVNDSMQDYYKETPEGAGAMAALAKEAGCEFFAKETEKYAKKPGGLRRKFLSWLMPKQEKILELLEEKISDAAGEYPVRTYEGEMQEKVEEERQRVSDKLLEKGFTGSYPTFVRGDVQITAYEEQPFALLPDDSLSFRIFLFEKENRKGRCRRSVIDIELL